ncbi:hypothetical protein [Streptomyces axinellae]|uniref:Uncharacterized protein n=1 Tax=Streptomyces axinellae TaxID=552788 RepID=A0ABP6CZ74_9ACTN
MSETPMTPERLACTCARVGAHSKECQRYTPGHDLASPALEIERLRTEWRRERSEVARLRAERARYLFAWRSARERAVAYGEGTLRVVKDREAYQQWLRQREDANALLVAEVARLRAELAARPTRAAERGETE